MVARGGAPGHATGVEHIPQLAQRAQRAVAADPASAPLLESGEEGAGGRGWGREQRRRRWTLAAAAVGASASTLSAPCRPPRRVASRSLAGVLQLLVGDGRRGHSSAAPFDAIHVGAAAPRLPSDLVDQLAPGEAGCLREGPGAARLAAVRPHSAAPPPAPVPPGGRMVVPVGAQGGMQSLVVVDKHQDGRVERRDAMAGGWVGGERWVGGWVGAQPRCSTPPPADQPPVSPHPHHPLHAHSHVCAPVRQGEPAADQRRAVTHAWLLRSRRLRCTPAPPLPFVLCSACHSCSTSLLAD